MSEYIVRKGKFSDEVAKFEESSYPIDVYTINTRGCSCPSRYRTCKHTKILKAWNKINNPVGVVFDDEANIVGNLWME
jgi:uncharacterized Zn finger protein